MVVVIVWWCGGGGDVVVMVVVMVVVVVAVVVVVVVLLQACNYISSETRAASNAILFSNHKARGPLWSEHDHVAVAFESSEEIALQP